MTQGITYHPIINLVLPVHGVRPSMPDALDFICNAIEQQSGYNHGLYVQKLVKSEYAWSQCGGGPFLCSTIVSELEKRARNRAAARLDKPTTNVVHFIPRNRN